jgi:glycosyltransferase involved in cell wall biosynthesis
MGNRGLNTLTAQNVRRILYVAYPLLPVSDESCGGAEQMLSVLEAEMAERGHLTTLAGCAGSKASGAVFTTGQETLKFDHLAERNREHEARILELVTQTNRSQPLFDLIHDKSGSFWRLASRCYVPVLATLHLPRGFYPSDAFDHLPANLYFNCVSQSQRETFADLPNVLGVVQNGIPLSRFPFQPKKRNYLLWMGRICEEKGPHLAIEVAQRTGLPLVLVGQVYPFSYHQEFYVTKIRPHLVDKNPKIMFFETPTFDTKLRLLSSARALLVPSLVDETSSLVAMEAMACGTPVIGLDRGAIPEIVNDGVTGFVVPDVEQMASSVWRCDEIRSRTCRRHVDLRYTAERMASQYEGLYEGLIQNRAGYFPQAA